MKIFLKKSFKIKLYDKNDAFIMTFVLSLFRIDIIIEI